MDKSHRPPEIVVKAQDDESDTGMERESSLLPGMVRTPSRLFGLGSGADWAAPGSTVWEEDDHKAQQTLQTPLTGYGHSSEVWASATGSPLLDGGDDAAAAFDDGPVAPQGVHATAASAAAAQEQPMAAAGGLHVFGSNAPAATVTTALPGRPAAGPFSTSVAAINLANRPVGNTHRPYSMQPNYFTVDDGTSRNARTIQGPTVTVSPHYGGHTERSYPHNNNSSTNNNNNGGGGGANALPTLEDKHVAQSIIASAGLPLSMSSLVTYIKEGQPQFEEHGGRGGNAEAAIYGTTGGHRNYPNLSEPPLQQPPMPGDPYGGNARGAAGGRDSGAAAAGVASWMGVSEETGGGGWNVRATSPSHGPAPPPPNPPAMDFGGPRFGGPGNGLGLPPAAPAPPYDGGAGYLRQPPYAAPMVHGGAPGHGHAMHPHPAPVLRPKSESEILSDLLHFHANFFPPPPPPRVPTEQRRARAALWYHYASKWDITHRLPPPPRTPLPGMETEYMMGLPEMTRVPYHGDGWLTMAERWFAVTQNLFDFPEENAGIELDARVVVEQAVTS